MEQRTIFQLLNEIPDEREILKDDSSDEENIFEDNANVLSNDKDYLSELEAISDCDDYFQTNDRDEYFSSKNESCKWRKFQYNKQNGDTIHTQELISSAIKVTNEIDAFLKLIDDKMLENIVLSTNKKIERKKNQYKRDRDVQNLTKNELLALFGLLFLIGINKGNHTSTEELWTTDGTGISMVRACMSKKRFLFLLRNLRFDNEETRRKRRTIDKLAPIRFFLDSFITNCKSSYSVGQFVTVKSLEVFEGQNSSQNISKNLSKSGIKIFALCDAKTYFINNLEVYCLQPEGPYRLSNDPFDIVERLVGPIEGSNRNLTIGSWYTSFSLAESLLEKKITCIGAMTKDRSEIPIEFLPNKYKRVGTTIIGYRPDMTLVSHVPKANRSVILLSTMSNCSIIDEKTKKPIIALYYDMTKGAVDAVNQLCKAYFVARVTNQWPLALFFTLTNIASVNAQILYEANNENCRVIRKTFLKNLALSLMRNHLCERAKILTLPTEIRATLARYREEPIEIQKENQESRKRGRCHLCTRARNVDTTIKCKFCRRFSCKGHVETIATCIECKIANNEDM